MSLEVVYSNSACTNAVAVAYYADDACTPVACSQLTSGGGYATVTCGVSGSFEGVAAALFGGSAYMDSRVYDSSDCTGTPTQYEADLLGVCVPGSVGSFMYDANNFYSYSSNDCSGTVSGTVPNSQLCAKLIDGGSDILLGVVGTAASAAASAAAKTTAAAAAAASTQIFSALATARHETITAQGNTVIVVGGSGKNSTSASTTTNAGFKLGSSIALLCAVVLALA